MQISNKIFLTALLSMVVLFSHRTEAQELTAYRDSVDNGYNFWLYLPENYEDRMMEMPVVVFLHGRSLCGNDLTKVRQYGCVDALEHGRVIDAMIIAPQNPGTAWSPDKIENVINWVLERYPADESRLYVLGMSLGGYGTLDYVGRYPHHVAAAMALCGGSTLKDVSGMNMVPLWIMHGTADKAVPVSASKKVVEGMEASGDTDLLRYDWIPGCDHGRLARCFYMEKTYEWLFSHSLSDEPRSLNRDVTITDDDFANCYKVNIDRNFFAKVKVKE